MTAAKRRAWISLGANLGQPKAALAAALDELARIPGVASVRASRFYDTSPVDSSGPDYVNAAAVLETTLTPEALLGELQKIELAHGRVRPAGVHNAPRTLDLDLLAFEGETRAAPELTLPHPRMEERLFVLVPLLELEPGWRSPEGVAGGELVQAVRRRDPGQRIRLLD